MDIKNALDPDTLECPRCQKNITGMLAWKIHVDNCIIMARPLDSELTEKPDTPKTKDKLDTMKKLFKTLL